MSPAAVDPIKVRGRPRMVGAAPKASRRDRDQGGTRLPTVAPEPMRVQTDAPEPEPEPRTRLGFAAWGLAGLIGLTSLAAATISGWLVPLYLAVMALLLIPPALPARVRGWWHRGESGNAPAKPPASAGTEAGSLRSEGLDDPGALVVPELAPPSEVAVEPDGLDSGADESVDPVPPPSPRRTRGGRGRGRSKAAPAVLDAKVVRWVRVGPGQFVRVEGPEPSGDLEPPESPDRLVTKPQPDPRPDSIAADPPDDPEAAWRPEALEGGTADPPVESSRPPGDPVPPPGEITGAVEAEPAPPPPEADPSLSPIGFGWRLPPLDTSALFGAPRDRRREGDRGSASAGATDPPPDPEVVGDAAPEVDVSGGGDLPQAGGPAEEGAEGSASAELPPSSAGPPAFDGEATTADRAIGLEAAIPTDPEGPRFDPVVAPEPASEFGGTELPQAEVRLDDQRAATPLVEARTLAFDGESSGTGGPTTVEALASEGDAPVAVMTSVMAWPAFDPASGFESASNPSETAFGLSMAGGETSRFPGTAAGSDGSSPGRMETSEADRETPESAPAFLPIAIGGGESAAEEFEGQGVAVGTRRRPLLASRRRSDQARGRLSGRLRAGNGLRCPDFRYDRLVGPLRVGRLIGRGRRTFEPRAPPRFGRSPSPRRPRASSVRPSLPRPAHVPLAERPRRRAPPPGPGRADPLRGSPAPALGVCDAVGSIHPLQTASRTSRHRLGTDAKAAPYVASSGIGTYRSRARNKGMSIKPSPTATGSTNARIPPAAS